MNEGPLYDQIAAALKEPCAAKKCASAHRLYTELSDEQRVDLNPPQACQQPGYPSNLSLVTPRDLKRRSMQTQEGRCIFIHAIAHIEFNAINLALDAAYRYRSLPFAFTRDWLRVASEEATHFKLLNDYLENHQTTYGDYPAHNGLWDMAMATADDVIARMALVPRVLEARGLDVTPKMIDKLNAVNDADAAQRLQQIYIDEIEHVRIGSRWFHYVCEQAGKTPRTTFFAMIDQHLHGELKGPFNLPARLKAGFDEFELNHLRSL